MDVRRSPVVNTDTRPRQRVEIPDRSPREQSGEQLHVNVLYTTPLGTLAALKVASRLGASLGARPRVLMLYSVPYALPLEKPAVATDFLEEQIRSLARESTTDFTARIYVCREPRLTLRGLFSPHSVIVLAGRKRWWLTKEQRWARLLKRSGHEFIFLNSQ